ncbi:cellulose synthase operon protein YhjQ/BcsQ [Iodidimonas sp. SYSU 1G8]|uniref:AAA family ATPase n=1 Tax=Iodidimonas sp. SYSU 1G8 TaxID=3133967 RepID=UPI0031FE880C
MQVKPVVIEESSAQRDPFLAFVGDASSESIVRAIAESLLLPDDLVRQGSIFEARAHLEHVRSPRLLIIDIDGATDPLDEIMKLADVCELGTRLIAIGTDNDVALFRDLLSMGVADYLVKPVEQESLLRSINALEDPTSGLSNLGRTGKVISFIGTRGGTGVSTLVGNCGWAISRSGKRRVAMVDMDLHFGNLGLLMGAEPREGLADALQQPDRIDSLFLERVMSPCGDRLFVVGGEESLSQGLNGVDRFAVDALMGELRGSFHFVLIDLPRSASDLVYRTLQLSGTTVVVSDLSLAGMRDTVRLLKFVTESNPGGQIIVAVNRAGENAKAEIPVAEFEKGIGRKIDFKIGFEPNAVLQAANLGQPLIETRSATARSIEQVAERLAGPAPKTVAPRRKSLFARLRK